MRDESNPDCSPIVRMKEVVTRWEQARTVSFGSVDTDTIDALEADDFDGAPAMADDRPGGFVPIEVLKELAESGEDLTSETPGLWTKTIDVEPTVNELLCFTLGQPAAIVRDSEGESPGFFTLSDLNRHPVRAALYPLFAELESELALLIDRSFSDPWDWLEAVPKNRRAGLVGYWEMSKREDADIGPIAGAMLSDLGSVIEANERLRTALGYSSKRAWKTDFGGLNEQRHSIMHPVRPLVSSQAELKKLIDRLDRLHSIVERVNNSA